jgi:hypothetical protein
MRGLSADASQSPGIRFEVVMDGIPEELQQKMEAEIKEFEKKSMDIVMQSYRLESKERV